MTTQFTDFRDPASGTRWRLEAQGDGSIVIKRDYNHTGGGTNSLIIESDGSVDIAEHDGGTSGLKLGGTLLNTTAVESNQRHVTTEVTLGSSGQTYVVAPVAGDVAVVYSVINAALTTGDETLTVKDKDGNSMGTITLTQSGSAAGDVDTLTPGSNNTVAAGDVIEIETDGSNGTTTKAVITIVIDIT